MQKYRAKRAYVTAVVYSTRYSILVEVRDPAGAPVVNAWIEVTQAGKRSAQSGEAGVDGCRMMLSLEPGVVDLAVRARDLAPKMLSVTLGPSGGHLARVVLGPGLSVDGRLVDDTGAGVPGALVAFGAKSAAVGADTFLHQAGSVDLGIHVGFEGRTDANGLFQMRGMLDTPYFLVATQRAVRSAVIEIRPPTKGVVLTLPRAGAIKGRVTREGKPISVYASRRPLPDWHFGFPPDPNDLSAHGRDGTFELHDVQPGPVMLQLVGGYKRCLSVMVEPGRTLDLGDFEITGGASRAGVVSYRSQAQAGISIVLLPAIDDNCHQLSLSGETSADGHYAIRGIQPGRYRVVAKGTQGYFGPTDIEVTDDQWHRDLAVDLHRGGRVVGVVTNETGKAPHDRVTVLAEALDPALPEFFNERVYVGAGDRFEFPMLPPGRWTLTPSTSRGLPIGPKVEVFVRDGGRVDAHLRRTK